MGLTNILAVISVANLIAILSLVTSFVSYKDTRALRRQEEILAEERRLARIEQRLELLRQDLNTVASQLRKDITSLSEKNEKGVYGD